MNEEPLGELIRPFIIVVILLLTMWVLSLILKS